MQADRMRRLMHRFPDLKCMCCTRSDRRTEAYRKRIPDHRSIYGCYLYCYMCDVTDL